MLVLAVFAVPRTLQDFLLNKTLLRLFSFILPLPAFSSSTGPPTPAPFPDDDDVFYLFLQKQKIGAELHIYLEEGTYHSLASFVSIASAI